MALSRDSKRPDENSSQRLVHQAGFVLTTRPNTINREHRLYLMPILLPVGLRVVRPASMTWCRRLLNLTCAAGDVKPLAVWMLD